MAAITALPISVGLILVILRTTVAQAKIRPVQLLRVWAYCTDVGWLSVALTAASVIVLRDRWTALWRPTPWNIWAGSTLLAVFGCVVACWDVVGLIRLYHAMTKYLQLRHPLATVVATGAICLLLFGVIAEVILPWT